MAGLSPVVRYLVPCDNVVGDPTNPRRVTLVGLISTIRSLSEPPFPVRHPELCVFLQLAECRGKGRIQIAIVQADSETPVFQTAAREVSLGNDPLEVYGLIFRIQNCPFPQPGLYWVQARYNDEIIAQQPLVLR